MARSSGVLDFLKRCLRWPEAIVSRTWQLAKRRPLAAVVLLALAALAMRGLWTLGAALRWWVPVALVGVAGVAALPDESKAKVLEWIGSVIMALVTLVGVNVLSDWIVGKLGWYEEGDPVWVIGVGLVLAFLVFAGASAVYLVTRGKDWSLPAAAATAGITAFVLIIGGPIIYAVVEGDKDEDKVPRSDPVPSQLDVLIVADPRQDRARVRLPAAPTARQFDVSYSVGFADGEQVRWTLTEGSESEVDDALADPDAPAKPHPIARPEADRVLVLVVDGTPAVVSDATALPDVEGRPGEVQRWRSIAREFAPGVPAYALLQSDDRTRIDRWGAAARPVTGISIQGFGSNSLTDTAVQLAVGAPESSQDMVLAIKHQPILLFDNDEPVPRPLSVEALFAEGRVKLCPLDRGPNYCPDEPLRDMTQLRNGDTRLELERYESSELRDATTRELEELERIVRAAPPVPAAGAVPEGTPAPIAVAEEAETVQPGEPRTAVYVHPVPREVNNRKLLYLDYWWYLPDNPARAGGGAFCGAGLVIPGISCFDHESDWEGVTVVIDRTPPPDGGPADPEPKAVHYAEHSSVVRYDWKKLRQRWDRGNEFDEYKRSVENHVERPFVFVARGTHASYPTPCLRSECDQTADDIEEQSHDGGKPWPGNSAATCGEVRYCVKQFPSLIAGSRPALWNAFDGPWGKRRCLLEVYCNQSDPPSAPGQQGRFKRPWACSGIGDPLENPPSFKKGGCLDD